MIERLYCRKRLPAAAVAAAFAASVASPVNAAFIYSLDDGTAESVDVFFGGGISYANHFTAVPGALTIGSISIAFVTPPAAPGQPITVKLWSDPDGNGNPFDAVVLSSVMGFTIAGSATGTFATFDIPDVTLSPGQSFFAGLTDVLPNPGVGIDQTAPDNQSLNGLSGVGSDFNFPLIVAGDYMIRANAVGAAIPEPGSLALLGLALATLTLTRRRRNA